MSKQNLRVAKRKKRATILRVGTFKQEKRGTLRVNGELRHRKKSHVI